MKTKPLTAAQIDTLAQRLSETPIEPATCLSYEFDGASARREPLPVSAKMRAAAVVGSSLAWS